MIARATVSPPTPESNTPIARSSLMSAFPLHEPLPPEGLRDLLLRLLEFRRPGLGGEVLPTTVGEEAHDVRGLELRGDAPRDVHDRARGDAGEDALLLGEVAVRAQGVGGVHEELPVEDRLVEDRRDESLLERAEAIDEVAELRLRGDDLDVRVVLVETTPDAHERSAGPEAGDEVRHLREVPHDLRAGPLVVRVGVRRVPVLERHEVAIVLRESLRDLDRAVRPPVGGGEDDLGAEELQEPDALLARVVRDHDAEGVALAPGDHRKRDAGVAGGRLEDRLVLGEVAGPLRGLDHPLRDAVLQGAGRVLALQLGPELDARLRAEARETDERRVADRVEDVGEAHGRIISVACQTVGNAQVSEALLATSRSVRSRRYLDASRMRAEDNSAPASAAATPKSTAPSAGTGCVRKE